jgi:hypothetical protein
MRNAVNGIMVNGNALYGERPPMKGLKETNGGPKHTTRSAGVNAGSPTSREAQGDGVPVVAKRPG